MLQAQKQLKLEKVGVKVEEESKGETIVGSSREVLRPPGKGITFTKINFLSVWVCLGSSPLSGLFILEALWLLCETSEEEEGEAEEQETSTQEQAGFNLAWVWMEEGVH